MTAPIIDIKNATVYRGSTRVFNGLNLSIKQNQNTAILGPNGAGKSTLLRLLSQMIYPVRKEGSYVKVQGRERWNVKELRRHMGIVSQDLQQQYKGWVTGKEVVLSGFDASIGLWPHQTFDELQQILTEEVIEELGVAGLAERTFESMSTGEQRRFLLGRALVHNPSVLILDEPTSGLDLKACFQYIEEIRRLIQRGKTVVLVTHHVHEIPPEIEHLVLIKNGQVLADGRKNDLLTSDQLTTLYDTPIRVVESGGFYQVLPQVTSDSTQHAT